MPRITRLAAPVLGAAAMIVTGSAAMAQQTFTLKIALFTPKTSTASRWFEANKKEIAERTNGRLNFQMYYGSSMGPMPRHYDLARKGVADMAFFQHGVTPGRFPLTELFHAPYLFPDGAKGSYVGAEVAGDLMDEYIRPEHKGTKAIWVVFNRPSGVYDSSKPIHSLDDMRGRRYRVPTPTDVLMLKELGALPIGMPATHMAESLQKGTIDGVVTDPMGVFAFKLGNLVKHYTPMFTSVISFGLAMNPKSYDRLPSDLKAIIDELMTKEKGGLRMAKLGWSGNFPVFENYMKSLDIDRIPMSPQADAEMRAVADRVMAKRVAELEKQGLPAREVYAKMKALSAKYSAM